MTPRGPRTGGRGRPTRSGPEAGGRHRPTTDDPQAGGRKRPAPHDPDARGTASPAPTAAAEVLRPGDAERVRDGVAEAIVGGPEGLRRTLGSEPAGFLALVAAARIGAEEADRLLLGAVTGARQAGHSWDAIGRLLGVSRQAAQQRFAAPAAGGPEPEADRRVLTGATAFTEMGLLAEEGARGWHLVDFGPLYLIVERSDHRWEHRRFTLPGGATQRRLERDGWRAVGTLLPFRYFKRAVDEPPAAG